MPFRSSSTTIPSVKLANKSAPPTTIRIEGWLNKQKHGKCRAWVKRYFVLYGEELRYYKSKTDTTNALAVISLDHYSLVPNAQPLTSLNQKQWRYHTFCLVSDDDTKFDWPDYFLQAENAEERDRWVDRIHSHVSQSQSVLDKWLDRLEVPQSEKTVMTSLYSTTTTNTSVTTLPSTPDSTHFSTTSTQSIRYQKSVESLCNFTSRSSSADYCNDKRRPSDFTSRSTDLSTKLFNSKIFNWSRPTKSSASSVTSVSSKSIDTTHLVNNDSLVIPNNIQTKPIESPIIHPSEYNRDDLGDCIATINQSYYNSK